MEDSGSRKEFPGGGMRDTAAGKERFELLWTDAQPYDDQMLTRAARWMARGAEKYESRNWEQFSGAEALEHAKASLLRHTHKLLAGQEDEDHAAAVWFNVQAIELIRWKQKREKDSVVEPPRYWHGITEVQHHFFRLDGDRLTWVTPRDKTRRLAVYPDVSAMKADFWSSLREVPINEIPEWAR